MGCNETLIALRIGHLVSTLQYMSLSLTDPRVLGGGGGVGHGHSRLCLLSIGLVYCPGGCHSDEVCKELQL